MQPQHLAAAFALALFGQAAQAAPTVGFVPGAPSVLVGESFALTLRGWGFDLTTDSKLIDNITGGQKFNLEFNPGQLELLSVQIAPIWTFTSGNKTGTVDNDGGFLTGMAFGTFPATTADDFDIATITFKALKAGTTPVIPYGGEFAAKVNNLAGAKILPSYEMAQVQVVPEPGQWALMLAGLGLVGWRLRKR